MNNVQYIISDNKKNNNSKIQYKNNNKNSTNIQSH